MGRFNVIRVEREGDVALRFQLARRAVYAPDPTAPVPKDEGGKPTVVVDENGHAVVLVSPPGQPFSLRADFAELDSALLAELAAVEAKRIDLYDALADQAFAAFEKKPDALEQKVAAASQAAQDLDRARAELAVIEEQKAIAMRELARTQAANADNPATE
jgi:hypothetical protein